MNFDVSPNQRGIDLPALTNTRWWDIFRFCFAFGMLISCYLSNCRAHWVPIVNTVSGGILALIAYKSNLQSAIVVTDAQTQRLSPHLVTAPGHMIPVLSRDHLTCLVLISTPQSER